MYTECFFDNCKKQPVFNNYGKKFGIFCCVHKKETMINVEK